MGIWASLNTARFKQITERFYPLLSFAAVVSALLVVAEAGTIFGYSYNALQIKAFNSMSYAWGEWKLSTAIWTIVAIPVFIETSRRWLRFKSSLEVAGKHSFVLMLLNGIVIKFFLLVGYKFGGTTKWYGTTSLVIMTMAGILIPIALSKLLRQVAPRFLQRLLLGS
jgi:hypothetical protein